MGFEVTDEQRERTVTIEDATRVDDHDILQIVSLDAEQRLEMERMDCPVLTDPDGNVWVHEDCR